MSIVAWILLGLVAGWLAGQFARGGGGGYGMLGDIVLGILGALVGGMLTRPLLGVGVTGFNLPSVIIALIGAALMIRRAPFASLFGSPPANGSVLELHFVVALMFYALVAWLFGKLTWLMFGETWSAVTASARSAELTV